MCFANMANMLIIITCFLNNFVISGQTMTMMRQLSGRQFTVDLFQKFPNFMNQIADEAVGHMSAKFIVDKAATQSLTSKFAQIFRSHMDSFVQNKVSVRQLVAMVTENTQFT